MSCFTSSLPLLDHQTPRFNHRLLFTFLHCPCSGCAFHSYSTTYPEVCVWGGWREPLSPAHLVAPALWLATAPSLPARYKHFPLASYCPRFISSHNALGRERGKSSSRARARALYPGLVYLRPCGNVLHSIFDIIYLTVYVPNMMGNVDLLCCTFTNWLFILTMACFGYSKVKMKLFFIHSSHVCASY